MTKKRRMEPIHTRPAVDISVPLVEEVSERIDTPQVRYEVAYPCPSCFNTLGGVARRGPRKTMTLFYAYCTACPHSWVQEEKETKQVSVTVKEQQFNS